MATVSVIIPVYNGEKYIEDALESVFSQTFRDFEVVVVNDGSTDGTGRRLGKYRERIRYHAQPNRGLSASRGVGLRLASGSLIAFLDADDIWLPGKLERQVQVACAHPEYGIITTDVEKFDESGVTVPSLKCWYRPTNGFVMESLLSKNWIPPSAALVRRECFDLVHTFDVPPPNYGEDWMMWVQIAARFPVYFVDEVLVRNRRHAASMTSGNNETQFQCTLRNLELMKARVPALRVRPALVRQAGFAFCLRRARVDLEALEIAPARDKLRRGLGYRPYSLKAAGLLMATYLPLAFLRVVKGAIKGFRAPSARRGTLSHVT